MDLARPKGYVNPEGEDDISLTFKEYKTMLLT
jgi:hypothetical protein